MKYAVLTADIINSVELESDQRTKILDTIKQFLEYSKSRLNIKFSITRGDSFQAVYDDPHRALREAFLIQSLLKSFIRAGDKRKPIGGVRISIGIGEIDFWRDSINESDGEAFRFSGRALEDMKKEDRIFRLTTHDKAINELWDVILRLMEEVVAKWSSASAEVVHYLLQNMTEEQISNQLNISQPAVNYRKKHGGWNALIKAIHYFEKEFSH